MSKKKKENRKKHQQISPKKNNDPWTNGEFDGIDLRKEIKEVGNFGMLKSVGKEKFDE